ncbi:hypothetical protein OC846_002746 [Tilletia horrida]|uniref:VTT domain-containing protein n=1 Tax=Tilletia horrida TaxID=155126 RepID=A0AAN6JSC6_9BASI|nr:hypothetical protein OC846_002746 [Tilletia horrida]KAK0567273.1 hypothetical protein OC861_002777 [Tilletia horrida]
MSSIWHYPDRGTGTPDFTLGSSSQHPSSASSSSSSSRDPRFQPKLQPIPSSPGPEPEPRSRPRPRSTLIIPSPRIATEDSLTLNDQSPPLTPTSPSHLNHTKSPLLPIWQQRSPSSQSSTATEADHHHSNWPSFYLLGSPPSSSSSTSPAPASASASASQRKKRTAVIHSRRRSELDHPLHSPRRTSIYEDDDDDNDDNDEEDDTLLPPYHQHHLAPPPRASFSNSTGTAAAPIATSRFWASASSPSSRSASPITMPPLFLPTNIHTSVSPCPSSSASSSSEYTRSTPALCPTRSHSITTSNGPGAGHHHPTVTRTMTPFAAFFGLRERPRRLDPPYLDDEQHSSSSPSPSSLILGALSYHRRRRSTTTAHGPLVPPPTSPTAATASALGSRFSWSRRSRRRGGGTDDDPSSAQAQAHAQHQASATVKDGNAIPWVKRSLPYLPSLIILAFIFVVSTGLVILALSSLPVQLPPVSKMVASSVSPSPLGTTHAGKAASESIAASTLPLGQTATSTTTDEVSIAYRLSHLTLADIRAVTTSLKEYARTGKAPVSFAELDAAAAAAADNATTLMSAAGPAGQEVEIDVRAGPLGLGLAKLHVLLVLSALFTWKQAFTIPGSIIMNVIFGALYGTFWGTVYTSVLTAFGGLCCYMLCRPLGGLIASLPGLKKPLLAIRTALDPEAAAAAAASGDARGNASNLMPYRDEDVEESSGAAAAASTSSSRPSLIHRSESMQDGALSSLASRARSRTNQWATGSGSSQTWSYLLLLRLLPIIPYGLTNIACSVLRTPILPFTVTLGLGSVPWNVLTCQVGELLEEVLSVALDVAVDAGSRAGAADQGQQGAIAGVKAIVSQVFWKRDTMFKLGLVTLASLTPVLLGRVLKGKQQTQPQQQHHHQYAASGMSTLEETAPMMVMQDRYTLRGDDHEEEDDGQHIYGGRIGALGRRSMDASQQSSSLSNDGRHYVVNPLPPPPPAMGSSTAAEEMHHPPHRPWWLDVDEVTSSASE